MNTQYPNGTNTKRLGKSQGMQTLKKKHTPTAWSIGGNVLRKNGYIIVNQDVQLMLKAIGVIFVCRTDRLCVKILIQNTSLSRFKTR